jgi:glutathione S-transferase
MLDSPYVRRVAISLQFIGVPFEHRSLSVFRQFDQFQTINPVVKAPTLVCDDGTVLMDSTLILDYAQSLASAQNPGGASRSLIPTSLPDKQYALRIIGLALAAMEKSIQIVYERRLRPADKVHEPWVERVTGQLLMAFNALESDITRKPLSIEPINQAGITTAVAWYFVQALVPDVVPAASFPAIRAFSDKAEQLPEFRAAPHGDGTYRGKA